MVWRQESSLGRHDMKGCQGLKLLTRSACKALDFATADWLFGLILLLGCCLRVLGKEAAV